MIKIEKTSECLHDFAGFLCLMASQKMVLITLLVRRHRL